MNRRGFTLVELLIVVVIIGILAAIAIPKFASTKEKAYLGTMKSDLRNLASAEEGYFYDHDVYYGGAIPGAGFNFRPSQAVSITLSDVSVAGWAAVAAHTGTTKTCALFYGAAAPPAPAVNEGVVACN